MLCIQLGFEGQNLDKISDSGEFQKPFIFPIVFKWLPIFNKSSIDNLTIESKKQTIFDIKIPNTNKLDDF